MDEAVKSIAKGFHLNTKHINQKKEAIMKMQSLLRSYENFSKGNLIDFLNVLIGLDGSISKVTGGKVLAAYKKPYLDYAKSVNFSDDNTQFITIHKSKGLGFDNVLLVLPEKDVSMNFLLRTDLQHKDDDHRLYYVACSRARNRLFINLPELSKEEKEKLIGKFGDVICFSTH